MKTVQKNETDGWRHRLKEAIDKSGRSQADISLSVGLSRGYLTNILKEDKDPTVNNMAKICKEIGVSLSQIIYGHNISPEVEEILSLMEQNPHLKDGILAILRAQSKP